jgi:hypothetical protein
VGLGKLLSFIRGTRNDAKISDVKLDPGGGSNVTSEHFSAPGDDAHPLPGDYVVHVTVQRSGGSAVVGYLDPKNDQKAGAGEKRIYARDEDGVSIVELWLKNTGEATLANSNGYLTLNSDGEIEANGARITPDGDVITATGVSLNNHPHSQGSDSNGDSEVDTNPPTPTE